MKKYEHNYNNLVTMDDKSKENKPLLTLIFGIVGELSSGKESAAKYLESKYNFRCINIDKLNEDEDNNYIFNINEIENISGFEPKKNTLKNDKEKFEPKSNRISNLKDKKLKSTDEIFDIDKDNRKMSGNKAHNKLVDLITFSYELNNINKNDTQNKMNENEYENHEEKNLSICLSTSIMEYDNREKNTNSLKETIRDITDNFAVIHPLKKLDDYEELNRNYFRLININAPIKKRMKNYLKKHPISEEDKLTQNKKSDFEIFLDSDEKYYFENKDIKEMQTLANYHISNDGSLEDLKYKLDELSSTLHQTFRPNWDDYFMKITIAVSERSNCMKQRIGAVIVKDFRIISTGYNGMSSSLGNCYLGNCPRCNIKARQGENLHNCICIHAEESAIIELGTFNCKGSTLYTTNYPCIFCTKMIVKAEISEIVYFREYKSEYSTIMLEKAGIKIKKWNKPDNHY